MRKFRKESTAPAKGDSRESDGGFLRSHWCMLSLAVILVVAFLLRTVFAYGISADGNFALSGGASAEYHLHMIENILDGSFALTDSAVNYPYGGVNVYAPLLDFLGAIPAFILSAMGMSNVEAASAGLAVITPIIGALTCIPVYLVGKELYDRRIGVVSALIFAFLALPISTSVFSNGTEYALAAFMVAFMSLFMIKAVKGIDAAENGSKPYLVSAILAGVFFGLAALSWTGFLVLLAIPIAAMFIQLFINRFNGKSLTDVLIAYSVIMLIGVVIAAAYYIPADLFNEYASSPLCITILAIVFGAVFMALQRKPWIVVVPALAIAAIAIFAILKYAIPDIGDLVFGGVSIYASDLIGGLINNRVSMSNVSSYYGWLTMWLPICLGIYELYILARKERSAIQIFKVVWLFVLFFTVWTTNANAAAVAVVFGVGSGAALVKLISAANLKDWWAGMKGAGFPGVFKKLIKPLPFASVIIVAFLVIVPNVTYGVDAGMPNNNDPLFGANGNTQFVIKTGDEYPAEMVWDYYADMNIDGAMVNWIDNTYDTVTLGGFDSVTDTVGNGAVAASSIYLSEGGAGAAAAMAIRLAMCNPDTYSRLPAQVVEYFKDADLAREAIDKNASAYGYINGDMDDESAIYLASVRYVLDNYSTPDIMDLYSGVSSRSGDNIGYIYLDPRMLPLQYNDGSVFSTMAYIGGYAIDSNGAAKQFFTYNTYYGTTVYTDALYETLIWKAMIGQSAADAGYSSSYSYLSALALNDGSVTVTPGLVEGFEVGCWFVKYNPDKRATVSDDGWEYMPASEAMAKQKSEGGLINYLSSIMVLEFKGVNTVNVETARVVDSMGNPIDGAVLKVYAHSSTYGKDVVYSSSKSINGEVEVCVPEGPYYATLSVGGVTVFTSASGVQDVYNLPATTISGTVTVGDEPAEVSSLFMKLTGKTTGKVYDNQSVGYRIIVGSDVNINSLIPDTYDYTITNQYGTEVASGTIKATMDTDGVNFPLKAYKITATVNDPNGQTVAGATVVATDAKNGYQYMAVTDDEGVAEMYALAGTYAMTLANGYANASSSSITISSSDRTTTLTAYPAVTVSVNGATGKIMSVYAGEFSTVTHTNGTKVDLPASLATDHQHFSFYACYGDKVYSGVYDGGASVSISESSAVTVTGTLKDNGNETSGTVRFISSSGVTFAVAANDEGKFTIKIPAGSYTVYADDGSNSAYIGTKTAVADIGDIELEDARKVNMTLRYNPRLSSTSTTNLPFVMSVAQIDLDSVKYTFFGMSNTSGTTTFVVPTKADCRFGFNNADGLLDTKAFSCTDLSYELAADASASSQYFTIKAQNADGDVKQVMDKVSVTADYAMTLTYYDEDASDVPEGDLKYEFSAGQTLQVVPGQYDVVIKGDSGAYYKGAGYVYPGVDSIFGIEPVEVTKVNIVKGDGDAIVITSEEIDDETGEYFIDGTDYYFQKGFGYYIVSTNGDGDDQKINYGYVDADSSVTSVNVTATAKKITITGYVGAAYDGELIALINGSPAKFDIDTGAYKISIPSGLSSIGLRAEVTSEANEAKRTFEDAAVFNNPADKDVFNLNVLMTDYEVTAEDYTIKATLASASGGQATVSVEIENLTDADRTYIVSSGSAWYASDITVEVPANSIATGTITGYYSVDSVSTGTDGFTVIVSEVGGTVTKEAKITSDATSGATGIKIVTAADGDVKDKISAYEYMFAITFESTVQDTKAVKFASLTVPNFGVALVDGDNILPIDYEFKVGGYEKKTVYVKLLPTTGSDIKDIPSITLNANIGGTTTTISEKVQTVDFESDSMDASGDDIYNERSGIPAGVWILIGMAILLAIMVCWLASKRGVFSRRN